MLSKEKFLQYFEKAASKRLKWKKRNSYYHRLVSEYYRFIIPEGSKVLEVGCGTGELLASVQPADGLGIDFSQGMLDVARQQFPNLRFVKADAEDFNLNETFDFIIVSDLLGSLWDVQQALACIRKHSTPRTRVVFSFHNYVWEPVFRFGENIGLKDKMPLQSWLSHKDVENLLELEGFETVKMNRKILFPKNIPLLSPLLNRWVANLPLFNHLCMTHLMVARPKFQAQDKLSVTIVVPARNERGNIENAILRTPAFGSKQEFIFIEGNSADNTYEEMLRVQEKYKDKNIVVTKQTGKGKGNAVREAFDIATGDVLMILDADLTTPPEDMPKFFYAIEQNTGEFINGCRLIFPMDKNAMRFLNLLGNKFFSMAFTFLLGQRLKDTLCGTKVLFRSDYEKIKANRKYFGDFDPFGDFDLLFGAAKLNMKIVEVPIRYRDREYGSTQISRFTHGWLLLRMCAFAARKIKFI